MVDAYSNFTCSQRGGRRQKFRGARPRILLWGIILCAILGSSTAQAIPKNKIYDWPTGSPVPVVRPFDNLAHDWESGNRGVDLALPIGSPVLAAGDGIVTVAGMVVDRPVIAIAHTPDLRTTYEPVIAEVKVGEAVQRGQKIGVLDTGLRGEVLHWGAKLSKHRYLDPLRLLVGEIVLKPWE